LGLGGLAFIAGGAIAIPFLNRYYQLQTLIFADALVQVEHNRFFVMLWDEVDWLKQMITEMYQNGVKTNTIYAFRLHRKDGQLLLINKAINNIDRFTEILQEQVTGRQLPKAVERYNAGKKVEFGPLTVSQAGVSNGSQTLKWEQISGVEI